MHDYSDELPVLFVALRDRPPIPQQETAAESTQIKSVIAKPSRPRSMITETARSVRLSRMPKLRKREVCAVAAVCLLAWPDAVQMHSHKDLAQIRGQDLELRIARLDVADKPRSLKWDLAEAFRD